MLRLSLGKYNSLGEANGEIRDMFGLTIKINSDVSHAVEANLVAQLMTIQVNQAYTDWASSWTHAVAPAGGRPHSSFLEEGATQTQHSHAALRGGPEAATGSAPFADEVSTTPVPPRDSLASPTVSPATLAGRTMDDGVLWSEMQTSPSTGLGIETPPSTAGENSPLSSGQLNAVAEMPGDVSSGSGSPGAQNGLFRVVSPEISHAPPAADGPGNCPDDHPRSSSGETAAASSSSITSSQQRPCSNDEKTTSTTRDGDQNFRGNLRGTAMKQEIANVKELPACDGVRSAESHKLGFAVSKSSAWAQEGDALSAFLLASVALTALIGLACNFGLFRRCNFFCCARATRGLNWRKKEHLRASSPLRPDAASPSSEHGEARSKSTADQGHSDAASCERHPEPEGRGVTFPGHLEHQSCTDGTTSETHALLNS
ncbi:unnamed protein product [Amoebophrya sp. A120]|nr:unnamed protein product [Amoebophrya sp. A120]|eukprot:GSA120T00000546001.1